MSLNTINIPVDSGQFQCLSNLDNDSDSDIDISEMRFSDSDDHDDEIILEEEIHCWMNRQIGTQSEYLKVTNHSQEPKLCQSYDTIVCVDQIPKLSLNNPKLKRLISIIKQIFESFGSILRIEFPDSNGELCGFVFIEYTTSIAATNAVRVGNGYELDKGNSLVVNRFNDILNSQSSFAIALNENLKDYPGHDLGYLGWFNLDNDAQDQFSYLQYANECQQDMLLSIWWNSKAAPKMIVEHTNWTMNDFQWSNFGTYLLTSHPQGVAIWAFSSFDRIQKYKHFNVKLMDISPNENFVVTYSYDQQKFFSEENLKIWDLLSGNLSIAFQVDKDVIYPNGKDSPIWPIIQWSFQDKYFAILDENQSSIRIFASSNMHQINDVTFPSVKSFSWRPTTNNIIAYWFPELNQKPAQVALLDIPDCHIIRQKSLINVFGCEIRWSKNGSHLICKVDHYADKKKRISKVKCAFEIFCLEQGKEIPVITINVGSTVIDYCLEPNGNNFAVISQESKFGVGYVYTIRFYKVDSSGSNNASLHEFIEINKYKLFWSPYGRYVLFASLNQTSNELIFMDTSDFSVLSKHFNCSCTDIEWDPTGRYVCTYIDHRKKETECNISLYTFFGKCYYFKIIPILFVFKWRNRSPTKLTKGELSEIEQNLSKYQKEFDQKDLAIIRESELRFRKINKELYDKFYSTKDLINVRLDTREMLLTRKLDPIIEIDQLHDFQYKEVVENVFVQMIN